MATGLIRCPQCQRTLQVASAASGMVRCPGCDTRLKIPAATKPGPAPAPPPPAAASGKASSPAPRGPVSPSGFAASPRPVAHSFEAAATVPPALSQSFLIRWGIVMGIGLASILIVGLLGLLWEPVAIAAIAAAVSGLVACLLTGQVWMAWAIGREQPALGIASFFVPLIGLVVAIVQRGAPLRGLVVYVGSLLPAGLALLLMLLYMPVYSNAGRAAARQQRAASRQTRLLEQIRQTEQSVAADAPLVTARFRLLSPPQKTAQLEADAEPLLSQCALYVPQSFQVDPERRLVTFQYRGPRVLAMQYRLLLMTKTSTIMVQAPAEPAGP